MRTLLYILFITPIFLFGQNDIPTNDTIHLSLAQIEGRWTAENDLGKNEIYIFNKDSTFFKAEDNSNILIFDVAGKFKVYSDTIRVVYQDMSRAHVTKAKIRTMYLKVIALSEDELNLYKNDRYKTVFLRLRRQKQEEKIEN